MERETGKMLSTMIRDPQSGDRLIRLSKWVNPEEVVVLEDDGKSPTLRVEVGRLTGTIDRDAYRHYLTKDDAPLVPKIEVPKDSVERSKVLSLFLGSSQPRAVNATTPKRPVEPLFRRA